MYNILLIDEDLIYGSNLISSLSNYNNDIRFSAFIFNKNEIVNAVKKYCYDIILINNNLMLEYYSELEEYKNMIILLMDNKSYLKDNKILHILKSESIKQLNNMILKLVVENSSNSNVIKSVINMELKYLGYNFNYYGTKYLCDAIYILFNDKEYNDNLKKDVYPIIAKKYNRTVQNVKCNIINATDIMICECEEKRLINYFGYCDYVKPSPKKVIQVILRKLEDRYQLHIN